MPPRRPHSKSRLGCKQCKQRRVKCDETGPVCHNCSRRGFDCSFQYTGVPTRKPSNLLTKVDTGAAVSRQPRSATSAGSPSTPWTPQSASQGVFSRSLELELMHQWCTSTCEAIVLTPTEISALKDDCPKWGLTHTFLMDSLFSISALHIAYLRPLEVYKYSDLSVAYQERAVASFQEALANPTAEQCPAMFYASAFIGVTTFALPRIHPASKSASGPVETLVNLSRLLSGTATIIHIARQLMGYDEWEKYFPSKTKVTLLQHEPDVAELLDTLSNLAQQADQQQPGGSPEGSVSSRPMYSTAVGALKDFMSMVTTQPNVVLAWCVMVGMDFMARLEDGDPLAQLITLCYGALLMFKIEDRWWGDGAARRLVEELSGSVAAQNPEWAAIVTLAQGKVYENTPTDSTQFLTPEQEPETQFTF